MNVVLIGCGSISKTHVEAISRTQSLKLTACYNRTEERGKAFAAEHGITYYDSVETMLNQERPDVVVNALAPRLHLAGLSMAASMGAALVVEKPFACTLEDCREIIDIAERHKVMLAVSESSAFNAANRAFAAQRAAWGKTLHIYENNFRHYFNDSRFKAGWGISEQDGIGGMLLNVGVHRIGGMRMIAGAPEISVAAITGKRPPEIPVEGDGSLFIRYANGSCGILQMCGYFATNPAVKNVCRIIAEKGIVELRPEPVFYNAAGERQSLEFDSSEGEYVRFYRELEIALSSGGKPPYSGEEAMRDVAVILAALESSRTGKEIAVDVS